MNENTAKTLTMDKKNKFAYFDLDGTLLNTQKKITKNVLKTITNLKEEGYKVGIATGRPPFMVKSEHSLVKPDLPVVSMNGAFVTNKYLDMQNPLFTLSIQKEVAKQIFQYLLHTNVSFLIYSSDTQYFYEQSENSSYWVRWLKETNQARVKEQRWKLVKIGKSFNFDETRVFKFLVVPDDRDNSLIRDLSSYFCSLSKTIANPGEKIACISSQENVLDITNANVSKGKYLQEMAKRKEINLERLIVFGDALNDKPLFEVAKFSVAMGNAHGDLKRIANYVTKSNDEEGVFHFFQRGLAW